MDKELKEFMKNNCRKCNELCEKGIVETKDFIKCVDKNITVLKENKNEIFLLKTILFKLGISANLKGYNYILKAVEILKKEENIKIMTLYKIIGNNKETLTSVERAIRNSINITYYQNKIFQKIYEKKPTNKQFLYDLTYNIDVLKKECGI